MSKFGSAHTRSNFQQTWTKRCVVIENLDNNWALRYILTAAVFPVGEGDSVHFVLSAQIHHEPGGSVIPVVLSVAAGPAQKIPGCEY